MLAAFFLILVLGSSLVVTIIDYGSGNLLSVAKAFRRLLSDVCVSARPEDVARADKIVLPGVGSLAEGMQQLETSGIAEVLRRRVAEKTPLLGICLGMQMFTTASEEGDSPGFGWIDAQTRRFRPGAQSGLKVPHLGWNEVQLVREHPIVRGIPSGACFYFAHSYRVECNNPDDVLATTDYGGRFASAIARGHLFGLQFHPEKSHDLGAQLIRNFLEYQP